MPKDIGILDPEAASDKARENGSPRFVKKNSCGPEAVYALLRAQGLVEADQKIAALVEKKCNPGLIGTHPDNFKTAVEEATQGRQTVQQLSFSNSTKAIKAIEDNLPCMTKVGSRLTAQHYITVTSVELNGGVKIFNTADGLEIPESTMKRILSQGPFENTVWTTKQREGAHDRVQGNLPPVDNQMLLAERRAPSSVLLD